MKSASTRDIELVLGDVPIKNNPTLHRAHLIHVNGCEALVTRSYSVPDSYYGNRYISQIQLNGTPLVQINSPSCPTCNSLLATGYGISNAHSKELTEIQGRINAPFVSLEAMIDALTPLLSLMKSGLYLIADAECYPTDGNGNFFWNTPNKPTENPATAGALLADAGYAYVSGHPIFLFPTQDTDCYDEKRVDYYAELFKKVEQPPRAILYNFGEFINFVLDGHHKACAAARLQEPLKSIVIIPCSGYGYSPVGKKMIPDRLYFAFVEIPVNGISKRYLPPIPKWEDSPRDFQISAGTINHRHWEKQYLDAASHYPSVTEYATMIAAEVSCGDPISDDLIDQCLSDPNDENQQKMMAILLILKAKRDSRLMRVALSCAKQLPFCRLKEQACKILVKMKGNEEIEQFFIDYLVEHTDKHDSLLSIIDVYWEKEQDD